jgi:AAA domain
MKVTILQGLPGSGKTHLYLSMKGADPHLRKVSADDYFMMDGVYRFNAAELPDAHAQCLRKFIAWAQWHQPSDPAVHMVVDNTNLRIAELAPYVAVGQAYGHDVEVITVMCAPFVAFRRQIHQVPQETFNTMEQQLIKTLNDIPPWWKHSQVHGDAE